MSNSNDRVNFGSRIGAILASAGSAVGLGNIWRFPYETGNHGGAAFILLYLVCILVMGLPIMIAEFSIGRHSRANTAGSYKALAPKSAWQGIGYMGVLAGFLILSFYSVVAGWTLEYTWQAVANNLTDKTPDEFATLFTTFSQDPWRPMLWMVVFMIMTHVIIIMGVKKGIEQSSKIMMPMLFVLILVLVGCSLSLPDAEKGLTFLFKPDFSKLNPDVFLGAMGQAFFSLSLGLGCLSTYASYFGKDTNLGKTAASVAVIDTMVAIMAGVIIFPAAFSVGISPDAGPSLLFITLPNVFQMAFADMPLLAYVLSIMFYILLALAAFTSTISMHEVVTAFVNEEWKVPRKRAAVYVTLGCITLGVLASLSFGPLNDFKILGLSIFDFLDSLTSKVMLPLGGMLISIFTGWKLEQRIVWDEISNGGKLKVPLFKLYVFILKYVAPIAIGLIFVNELGLF
ncbi:MAG: sodium-dependent transporter [Bacteroidaceae bacterium]|nr:sodium-dependent transporter [Bacteroidaceae bacterium]